MSYLNLERVHYTLFVDESGDQDLDKFRTDVRQTGSDPFLVFGAALVPTHSLDAFRDDLKDILDEINSEALHCNKLSHLKRAYFARRVANMRALLFGVVSKKETVGEYRQKIEGAKSGQDYYNKCASYLLERVGHFMTINDYSSDQLSVIFDKKNHDYQRLRNFVSAIRKAPIDDRAKYMSAIDPLGITALAKKDEILLSLADLSAFSLYQSVTQTKTNFFLPEQRYLIELKEKFWKNPEISQVANHGIKYIKGPYSMGLQGDALRLAKKFYRKKPI